MNKTTYGEKLLERYLEMQQISFEREPKLPNVSQRIDFVLDHCTAGKLLLEVKDIQNDIPFAAGSGGAFDPYKPIREHIEEGTRKFKSTASYTCALVLAAPPGSFVDLVGSHAVLGAMYGDYGFSIPFNPVLGHFDDSQITSQFTVGRGKMVRKSRLQNTRIAALISVHEFQIWHPAMKAFLHAEDGRTRAERFRDIQTGKPAFPSLMQRLSASQFGRTEQPQERSRAIYSEPNTTLDGRLRKDIKSLPSSAVREGHFKLTARNTGVS